MVADSGFLASRRVFNFTSVGASHIKKNKVCQDCSASVAGEDYLAVVVSDGHGGDDYLRSDKGSAIAVEVSLACLADFFRQVDKEAFATDSSTSLKRLSNSIISQWNDMIWQHYESNPFTEDEKAGMSDKARKRYLEANKIESAYGSTLIVACCTEDYWFGLHIGDGKCVVKYYDSAFSEPIPWDEKCFLNSTTSICDSDASDRFRYYYSKNVPAAVFIGSDGIDDSFGSKAQLHAFYDALLSGINQFGFDAAIDDLRDFIPNLSAKGSGDDISVAGIVDIDKISLFANPDIMEKAVPDIANEAAGIDEAAVETTDLFPDPDAALTSSESGNVGLSVEISPDATSNGAQHIELTLEEGVSASATEFAQQKGSSPDSTVGEQSAPESFPLDADASEWQLGDAQAQPSIPDSDFPEE